MDSGEITGRLILASILIHKVIKIICNPNAPGSNPVSKHQPRDIFGGEVHVPIQKEASLLRHNSCHSMRSHVLSRCLRLPPSSRINWEDLPQHQQSPGLLGFPTHSVRQYAQDIELHSSDKYRDYRLFIIKNASFFKRIFNQLSY